MKPIILGIVLITGFATSAHADTCYQLSRDGETWSRTAELLCVQESAGAKVTVTLKNGMPSPEEFVSFQFNVLSRARCLDCNEDVFGIYNPSNSIFNELQISFDGTGIGKAEKGTVSIGKNQFFYRRYN